MLESICFRVLRLSLQMSILLLLSFLGNKWLTRRFAAQARCFLWMAFSIRLLIPASLSFALPSWGAEIQKATEAALPSAAQVGQAEAPAFVDVLPMGSTAGFAAPAEISYGQISAGEGIALLWLIGAVCFLLAHVGIHVFHMRFLRAHSEIVCGGAASPPGADPGGAACPAQSTRLDLRQSGQPDAHRPVSSHVDFAADGVFTRAADVYFPP